MTRWQNYLEGIALTGILILAAVMRLGWTGVVPFAQDEANLSLQGLNMMRNGNLIWLGAFTSVGFPHFPAGSWLYALPYAFTSDPLFATLLTAIASIIAIVGLWWVLRQHVGKMAALMAAVFLAGHPYAIIFSRYIWQPNPMMPITMAWLICAFYAITGKRHIALMTGLTVFLGGLLPQIHTAGFGIALATGLVFLRWRWWQRWKSVLAGGVLAAALTIPYWYYIACCGSEVLKLVGNFVDTPSVIDSESTVHTGQVIIGTNWQRFLAHGVVPPLPFEDVMAAFIVVLILLALVRFARDYFEKTGSSPRRVLVELAIFSIVCMPLIFLKHSSPARAYYMLPVLPGAAMLVGLSTLAIERWGKYLIVPVGIIALLWSYDVGRNISVVAVQTVPDGISTPLNIQRDAAYFFPDTTPEIYLTHGDTGMYTAQSMTMATLWWDRPKNRVINGENLLILPPYPGVLMSELKAIQAWEELQAAGLTGEIGHLPRRQGEDDYVYVCYDGVIEPAGFTSIDSVAFEHGVKLEGWKARYVGDRLRISTLWQVGENFTAPNVGTMYQQFQHLYAPDAVEGQPLYVSDVPITLYSWRSGDRVIVMADFFNVPPGKYVLNTGHYLLATGQRMQRADGQGDSVQIELPDTTTLIQQLTDIPPGNDATTPPMCKLS